MALVVHDPEIDLSVGVALIRRPAIPHQRCCIVLRDDSAFVVHDRRDCIARRHGLVRLPCDTRAAQHLVLRNTMAILVHDPEIELGTGAPLVGRLAIPVHCVA